MVGRPAVIVERGGEVEQNKTTAKKLEPLPRMIPSAGGRSNTSPPHHPVSQIHGTY
jgi:hypothetical protein